MSQAFLSVYDENVSAVFGFLAYRAGSQQEAEDLTQLTFERALKAWPRFDPTRASARTWLLSIARNALIDETRRARRDEISLDSAAAGQQSELLSAPDNPVSEPGLRPELADALQRLSQREREALALRFGADMGSGEIADALAISVANVHQITSRALRKLRAEIQSRNRLDETAESGNVRLAGDAAGEIASPKLGDRSDS